MTTLPASVTIVDLPLGSTLVGTELLEVIQTTNNIANSVQIPTSQIALLAASGLATSIVAGSGISAVPSGPFITISWSPGTSVVAGNAMTVATTGTTVTVAWSPGTTIIAGSGIEVTTTATTATVAMASTAGPSVIGNASAGSAYPAAIVGAASQVLAVNAAATTVLFQSLSTTIDLGIGSTGTTLLWRSATTWIAQSLSTSIDLAIGSTASTILYRTGTTWLARTPTQVIDAAIGSTQGNILYRNAASWVVLGPGTNGQLLQTQGAAANPQWVGGVVLLNTLSPAAVATVGDITSLTSTYRDYMITFENVAPAGSAVFEMQIATTGTAFVSGGYVSMAVCNVSALIAQDSSTSVLLLSGLRATTLVGSSSICGVSGFIKFFNPASTVNRKMMVGELSYLTNAASGTAAIGFANVNGYFDSNSNAVTGIQFLFSAGNIATGTIKVYGLP